MFECFGCHRKYDLEKEAVECCTYTWEDDSDDEYFQLGKYGTPVARTHFCPNVMHGGKNWSVMLKVEEKCPMCEYVYRPR